MLADAVSFTAASTGVGNFVFASSRASFLTLNDAFTAGHLVDGSVVSYVAQNSATIPTEREWGRGTYSRASSDIARTTPFGGTAATPVDFSAPPVVSLTALAADLHANVVDISTSYAIDAQYGGTMMARLTSTGDTTLVAPVYPFDGQRIIIEYKSSGAATTLTLTTGSAGAFAYGTDITAPLSATAQDTTDMILVVYSSAANRWRVAAVTKGF